LVSCPFSWERIWQGDVFSGLEVFTAMEIGGDFVLGKMFRTVMVALFAAGAANR
jgi:hypothetical protein